MGEAADNYGRRVDDLIAVVQQTIQEVDDFLRGRMKVEPGDYQRVKRELMAKQSAALEAMNKAIAGQQDLLKGMQATGEPLPARRASDQRRPPQLRAVESIGEEELFDIKVRAGIQ